MVLGSGEWSCDVVQWGEDARIIYPYAPVLLGRGEFVLTRRILVPLMLRAKPVSGVELKALYGFLTEEADTASAYERPSLHGPDRDDKAARAVRVLTGGSGRFQKRLM